MYSSSNLSRLSYISGIDATLQNSTAIYGPVNTKVGKAYEIQTELLAENIIFNIITRPYPMLLHKNDQLWDA